MSNMMTESATENYRRERKYLEALYWGGVLLWTGFVFAADSLGILPQIGQTSAWSWIFIGAGLYSLLLNLWGASSPDRPNPKVWDWVWAGALLILGLGGFIAIGEIVFALILLLIGAAILGDTLLRSN